MERLRVVRLRRQGGGCLLVRLPPLFLVLNLADVPAFDCHWYAHVLQTFFVRPAVGIVCLLQSSQLLVGLVPQLTRGTLPTHISLKRSTRKISSAFSANPNHGQH